MFYTYSSNASEEGTKSSSTPETGFTQCDLGVSLLRAQGLDPRPPKHPQHKVAMSDYACAIITHLEAWGESGWGKNGWKDEEWLGDVSGDKKQG